MRSPTRRPFLAALSLVACTCAVGCGGDDPATNAVAGTTYENSPVCDLLPVETVAEVLPGARIDTSLPTPDSCFYAADAGDLILTALSPQTVARRLESAAPAGPPPTPQDLVDMALADAKGNGATDVRSARELGDDGTIAINAGDDELTAVWRRGDVVYDIQYSLWDRTANGAAADAKRLARAVLPLG